MEATASARRLPSFPLSLLRQIIFSVFGSEHRGSICASFDAGCTAHGRTEGGTPQSGGMAACAGGARGVKIWRLISCDRRRVAASRARFIPARGNHRLGRTITCWFTLLLPLCHPPFIFYHPRRHPLPLPTLHNEAIAYGLRNTSACLPFVVTKQAAATAWPAPRSGAGAGDVAPSYLSGLKEKTRNVFWLCQQTKQKHGHW